MEQGQEQQQTKNAKLIFEVGSEYDINAEDLSKALAYAKE